MLFLSAEGGYHRVFDRCVPTWLNQAGVKTEYVEMENVGLRGNGHQMMLEKNSADIAKYMGQWLAKNAPAAGGDVSKAMPPKSIPTFATDNIAAKGFLYAGGSYVGEPGKQIMHGSMYTEVWVPKQIKSPYPMVIFHGNGQTAQDWLYTPDGRKGWVYALMDAGYVVYMVDYPARGRSAYVPLKTADGKWIDGNFGIRTGLELARIWTAGRELGDFPRRNDHTQWPGSGKPGDPIFDTFIRTQVQFAGESTNMAVPAAVALLDQIGTPVIMFTHSQGGGVGFEVTEQRPKLVHAMVAIEPGGPQFGPVNTSNAEAGPRNANSWGLTTAPYEYDAGREQALGPQRVPGSEAGASGRGALLDAGRAGAQARAMEGHQGAQRVGGRHVSPHLRSVHPEIPAAGGRAGRVRASRGRRHPRQQPHDDAREEQRPGHQLHHGVAPEERAGAPDGYSR